MIFLRLIFLNIFKKICDLCLNKFFITDVEDDGGRGEGDDHLGQEGAGGPDQEEGEDEGWGSGRGSLQNTNKY